MEAKPEFEGDFLNKNISNKLLQKVYIQQKVAPTI